MTIFISLSVNRLNIVFRDGPRRDLERFGHTRLTCVSANIGHFHFGVSNIEVFAIGQGIIRVFNQRNSVVGDTGFRQNARSGVDGVFNITDHKIIVNCIADNHHRHARNRGGINRIICATGEVVIDFDIRSMQPDFKITLRFDGQRAQCVVFAGSH